MKLYQIPAFDEEMAVMLAEDVFERYQYESIETVIRCLKTPPATGEKNWRLTPDTIQAWMEIELEKDAAERERINNLYKTRDAEELHEIPDIPDHVNQLIENYKQSLKDAVQPVRPLTEKEIKQEGQHRPKKPEYRSPAVDYVSEWEKKMRTHQYQTVKDRHPELNNEQIEQIVNKLPL